MPALVLRARAAVARASRAPSPRSRPPYPRPSGRRCGCGPGDRPPGFGPSARGDVPRRGGRCARHRSRTRSRSCVAGPSCGRSSGGGTPSRRHAPRAGPPSGHSQPQAAATASTHARSRREGVRRRPCLGGNEMRDPGRRAHRQARLRHALPEELEDRTKTGVAVLGADGPGVDHHVVGARRVTAWCSRAASL